MSDFDPSAQPNNTPSVPDGFIRGPNGEKSSGRLIKILAIIFAGIISITAIWFAIYVIISSNFLKGVDSNFVNLVLGLVGIFGSIAIGAEITQKVTRL